MHEYKESSVVLCNQDRIYYVLDDNISIVKRSGSYKNAGWCTCSGRVLRWFDIEQGDSDIVWMVTKEDDTGNTVEIFYLFFTCDNSRVLSDYSEWLEGLV